MISSLLTWCTLNQCVCLVILASWFSWEWLWQPMMSLLVIDPLDIINCVVWQFQLSWIDLCKWQHFCLGLSLGLHFCQFWFSFRSFGFSNVTPNNGDGDVGAKGVDSSGVDSGVAGSDGVNRPRRGRKRPNAGDVSPILPGSSSNPNYLPRRRLEFK